MADKLMRYIKILFIFCIVGLLLRLPLIPILGWEFQTYHIGEYAVMFLSAGVTLVILMSFFPRLLKIPIFPSKSFKSFDEEIVEFHEYLKDCVFVFKKFLTEEEGDHDHCEFCGQRISQISYPGSISEAYHKEDSGHWICPKCFEKYEPEMRWKTQ